MRLDRIAKIIYTEPRVLNLTKVISKDPTTEEIMMESIRKSPLKINVLVYDQRGKMLDQGGTISAYA